ncbi:hypothetical protein [uncultured Halovibrio sp.]|uniref:hypothetical protein n=1 Tax=uncultured Halovibrio sp. TaxID=985049 RepID=UPI0025D3BCE4|nr:hypothetical protein [uncultured Halovibrio sp.]
MARASGLLSAGMICQGLGDVGGGDGFFHVAQQFLPALVFADGFEAGIQIWQGLGMLCAAGVVVELGVVGAE